jgi:hypothetical protein
MLEQGPGGDGIDAQHAGLHAVDLRRHLGEMMFRRGEMLRPAAGAEQRDDDIAFRERDDGAADLLDLAAAFMAGMQGGCAARP